jgi:hypothetical protein
MASSFQDNAESLYDIKEVIKVIKEDDRMVQGYPAKCRELAALYHPLAGPLHSPEIGVWAERLLQRAKDVELLTNYLHQVPDLFPKAEEELEELIQTSSQDPKMSPSTVAHHVRDLPSVRKLHALAELMEPIQNKILDELENRHINFLLYEDYLGGEAKVASKIEKIYESMSTLEELHGSEVPWGCLNVYYDEGNIEHWLSKGTIF